MKKTSIILLLLSSALLAAIFFVPLWHIRLEAPQYPDGLDMYIWIHQITGTDEFTLQNINILNHYVGMAPIKPGSFVELNIMPYVLLALIILSLGVLLWRNRYALVVYTFILIIAGTVGLGDFYFWIQKFGNNLDPQAPIVVPGMSYSPPFLGIRTLLNITAISVPDLGGYFFGLVVLFLLLAIFFAYKKESKPVNISVSRFGKGAVVATCLLLLSCTPEPQEIAYGSENCHHCQMTISDNRYGAELVTKKGKVFKFDSAECLAAYVKEQPNTVAELLLVSDFENPGHFINASEAIFMQSENQPSPMGLNLTAFADQSRAIKVAREKDGKLLAWSDVLQLSTEQALNR
jgi:copper chaperone NosL